MMQPADVQISSLKTMKKFLGIGVVQIVFGILLIITSSLEIGLSCDYYGVSYVASGIWSGVVIISAGAVGVAAAEKNKTDKCLLDALLGTNIASAAVSTCPLIFGIVGLALYGQRSYCYYGSYTATLVLSALLLLFGMAAFAASIVGIVYDCQIRKKLPLFQRHLIIHTDNGPMMLVPINASSYQPAFPYQSNFAAAQTTAQPVNFQYWQQPSTQNSLVSSLSPAAQPMASPAVAQVSYENHAFAPSTQSVDLAPKEMPSASS